MPRIPTLAGVLNPIDNLLDLATSALYGGNGQNAIVSGQGMINPTPVREQLLRQSQDRRVGCGQDDSMPNIPTVSINVAQHDIELEKQRMM